ncbi:uncharacterized protein Z518_00022 [Rhinocladiella mackenziei CBS 650.93]|uniref:DUF6594 domain-containing protein n=1 Tax=Rhinocladiella mackenziei CBS 650.93 TaxID=1442369 RepID=A0A0D2ISI6_9EURO|nr:uncharacterized protein Z518_00022 [Rhinocladiella mackenziei CBS 650.93]KIX08944.1 hypothetical protein Z518_00022 [Rhinocladiella mackenziei CBS 650.93]
MTASSNTSSQQPYCKRGYMRLAEYMAWDPAMAILPRFRSLNIYNLLLLQAEISELDEALTKAVKGADSTDEPRNVISTQLRQKLGEYNQAVVNQIIINNQPNPGWDNLADLLKWLKHTRGGNSQLRGPGADVWYPPEIGGRPHNDHSALDARNSRKSILEKLVSRHGNRLLRRLPGSMISKRPFLPEEGSTACTMYSNVESFEKIGDNLASFSAAILMLIPVVVLHFLRSANMRLLVIVIFSICFTALLVTTTKAERSQVIAASAAFVAVQVVYVGSALTQ